jgi:hypothetical protein
MPEIIKSVDDKVQELKKSGKLPPGLIEQYDMQLKLLQDPVVPDFETVIFPGYYASSGTSFVPLLHVVFFLTSV